MSRWEDPQNMVVALGPGETVVDIRHPGQYDRWHGQKARDGLLCLDCEQPVNPRRLPSRDGVPQRDILVHSPRSDGVDQEDKCREVRSGRRGAGWRRALAAAIAVYARSLGYETEVEPMVAQARVDVLVRSRDQITLIRIELDKITLEQARLEHRMLTRTLEPNLVTRVLWLTYNCSWVDKELPALGIRFDQKPPRYRPGIDVAGLWCVVDAGIITPDEYGLLRQAEEAEYGLGLALRRFLQNSMHHDTADTALYGWAAPSRWVNMLRALGSTNRELQTDLQLQTERTARAEAALHKAKIDVQDLRDSLAEATRSSATSRASAIALAAALDDANAWAADVEALREQLLGKLLLRKIRPIPDPKRQW